MVGLPTFETKIRKKGRLVSDPADMDFFNGHCVDCIRNQWIHVANMEGDTPPTALHHVDLIFHRLHAETGDVEL